MRPKNLDGSDWSLETSNLAADDIRKRCMDDLHTYEEKVSGGRLNADNKWSPLRERSKDSGSDTIFVPDPVLASLKATGDDQLRLFKSRWARFCATPQDETPYLEMVVLRQRTEKLAAMVGEGEDIEAALAQPVAVSPLSEIEEPEPPKRKRGRPRGSRNRRVEETV